MTNAAAKSRQSRSDIWMGIMSGGIAHAIAGLSEMVGQEIRITYLSPRRIEGGDPAELLPGGGESLVVAIHLGVSGAASGHLLVLYQPETAFMLIDMLMGLPPGATRELGEMEQSVLGEMGNIMGAHFLTAIADTTRLPLRPSPPTVMMDMAGAVLDAAVAGVMMETDEVLVVETRFGTEAHKMDGAFLVLPNPGLQTALLGRWSLGHWNAR